MAVVEDDVEVLPVAFMVAGVVVERVAEPVLDDDASGSVDEWMGPDCRLGPQGAVRPGPETRVFLPPLPRRFSWNVEVPDLQMVRIAQIAESLLREPQKGIRRDASQCDVLGFPEQLRRSIDLIDSKRIGEERGIARKQLIPAVADQDVIPPREDQRGGEPSH